MRYLVSFSFSFAVFYLVAYGADCRLAVAAAPPSSCGAAAASFEAQVWDKVAAAKCLVCHQKGGDAEANAAGLRAVLEGARNAYRDVALLNAAAALIVAGKAKDLKEGVAIGANALDSGAALERLKKLIAISNA